MLNWFRREHGQEMVEYALVLPLLLMLILGTVQLALVVLAYNTIDAAAIQGARFGSISDNANYPASIQAVVYQVTDAAGLNRASLTFALPFKQADNVTIRVQIDYNMALVFPIGNRQSISLRAVSTRLIELQ